MRFPVYIYPKCFHSGVDHVENLINSKKAFDCESFILAADRRAFYGGWYFSSKSYMWYVVVNHEKYAAV